VFTARWTIPSLLKGTRFVFADLAASKHLIVSAILAGMLWAVANTLTVFAIRDVGLTIAFPLWNMNSLIGILWGRLLFGELKGASRANLIKVWAGAAAIILAAILLGFGTIHDGSGHAAAHGGRAVQGILAAAGASLLWGTMYIPYRKAYISGMNPLSFVTAFTVGELGTMLALVLAFDGGWHAPVFHSPETRHLLFWLFLGGFVWVVGDLFQQFATKYLGIGRGIPLSNTNQIWGVAWGVLVFGELAQADLLHKVIVLAGSVVMVLGAFAVGTAVETEREHGSLKEAQLRETNRYRLTGSAASGSRVAAESKRDWWDYLILLAAVSVFVYLGLQASVPQIALDLPWLLVLAVILLGSAAGSGWLLWRKTRFS
jgi:glucose uptake protein GlcU